MPSIINDSPLPPPIKKPSSAKQHSIEDFLQPPPGTSNPVAQASTATASKKPSPLKTPKSQKKKLTAKEKEDAEVLDRRNKHKKKDRSDNARAERKAARAERKESRLAHRRGMTGDGSDRKNTDGDEVMKKPSAILDTNNPLLVPLPEDQTPIAISQPDTPIPEVMMTPPPPNLENNNPPDQAGLENNSQQQNQAGSYVSAAQLGAEVEDDDTAVNRNRTYQVRRVRLTLKIKKPSDKEQRLQLLMQQANEVLRLGRKHESDLYIRNFELTSASEPYENKREWFHKFKPTDCSMNKFKEYFAGGLENYHPYSKETYYFRISLVAPHSCDIESLISEIDAVLPGDCKMTNILSQKIWDPTRIGSLLRSTEKLSSTGEFLDEINRRAALIKPHVVFGMNCAELRHPNIEKAKDWKSANKAIQLETNVNIIHDATEVALQLFPAKRPVTFKPIWGMNLMFMFDVSHPAVANLETAMINIATLINRNKRFREMEQRCTNSWILPGVLDDPVYASQPTTLRDILMSIECKTSSGCEGGKLFSCVCYSKFRGRAEYWFSFHKQAKKEAEAVVRALPTMLRVEYNITPEHFFFEGGIDPTENWSTETRRLENQVTNATEMMIEETTDLHYTEENVNGIDLPVVNEGEQIELSSTDERERQRMMGQNDEETMVDIRKKKPITKPKTTGVIPIPLTVDADKGDSASVGASSVGMGSVAGHSKTRQAQQEVLDETTVLIKENNKKLEIRLEKAAKNNTKKDKKIAKMEKQLAMVLARFKIATDDSDEEENDEGDESLNDKSSSQGSGQESGEASQPPIADSSRFDPNFGDQENKEDAPMKDDKPIYPHASFQDFSDSNLEKEAAKYPSDNSTLNDPPYKSSSEESETDSKMDNESESGVSAPVIPEITEIISVGSSSSSTSSSDSDSSSSSSSNSEDSDPEARLLPPIPPHKAAKPKNLVTTFNQAAGSTGGNPGPPT